ncbi:MAG TPA: aldose 1-epimerase family protein [Mycobacteriales bacterium]|jgi:aldose 1-epimerase|nr:aldose 1-epimerase family protein [Mycobacteriales bacterium]
MQPSGAQYVIRHGDQQAVAVAVGGGLRTYAAGGRDVLDGYAEDAICDGARCQTLIPWPNRVQDGTWIWEGSEQQLPLTEPEQHNAIHGLVRWLVWDLVTHTEDTVQLSCTCAPQPGYPWRLTVTNTWSLGDRGLAVLTTIRNDSDSTAPVAAGFHPYITAGTPTIDDALLMVPAATRILTGDQQIPVGREGVAGTAYDFRSPRRLGDLEIDHTYTDLSRDADGLARLRLTAPDGDEVTVWVDAAYPYLEVFTGDALPDPSRRRRGLGVEPMTAPPNALASGEAVVHLDPAGQWQGRWGIEPS